MQDRLPQLHETLLQRTAGPYIRVKLGHGGLCRACRQRGPKADIWEWAGDVGEVPQTDVRVAAGRVGAGMAMMLSKCSHQDRDSHVELRITSIGIFDAKGRGDGGLNSDTLQAPTVDDRVSDS